MNAILAASLIVSMQSQVHAPLHASDVAPNEPGCTPVVRFVNKTTGPYPSIGSALAASSSCDRIVITDSSIYYEQVQITPQHARILSADAGQFPYVSGEALAGNASVIIVSTHATIQGIGVYVGGAQYGIQTTAGPVTIDSVSFDIHIAPRGQNWTFGVSAGADLEVLRSNFLGPDTATQTSGGILSNTSTPISITVADSDFWGIGTAGGSIGVGQAAGSSLSVTGSVFAQSSSSAPVIAINSWGSTALVESNNAFRNINTPLGGNFARALAASDRNTSGSTQPVVSLASPMTEQTASDSLLQYLGCSTTSLPAYPDAATLNHFLARTIASNYYTLYPSTSALDADTLDAIDEIAPRIWEEFVITWTTQFDPATWNYIASQAADVRTRTNLHDVLLMGNLMEDIAQPAIEQTPMSADFWQWLAYQFPDAAARPLQAKIVNGRRIQAHWFSYTAMLGVLQGVWPGGGSVPNLRSQEGVAYYLYLAREFIDAGMNVVQLNQPQLTFGQNSLTPNALANQTFKAVVKFSKYYGACQAVPVAGHQFALVALSEIYDVLRDTSTGLADPTTLVDYTESVGYRHGGWTSLEDAFNRLPTPIDFLSGKPMTYFIDNSGTGDPITTYALAAPADRNGWLVRFDTAITQRGAHLVLNGVRQLSLGPGQTQNFTGYTTPPPGKYPANLFLPFDYVGGTADVERQIFAPR